MLSSAFCSSSSSSVWSHRVSTRQVPGCSPAVLACSGVLCGIYSMATPRAVTGGPESETIPWHRSPICSMRILWFANSRGERLISSRRALPSQVPSTVFGQALVDIVIPAGANATSVDQPGPPSMRPPRFQRRSRGRCYPSQVMRRRRSIVAVRHRRVVRHADGHRL